ncbi:MAG: universal stress protein [Halobacteria archaeon]
MYDDVLIPTDGTEGTLSAVRHGINIATKSGADLHVLYVVDKSGIDLLSSESTKEDIMEVTDEEGLDAVKQVTDIVSDRKPELETHTSILKGHPAETIVDYVADNGIDLVSMGTHGRTGWRRYLIGSVTNEVVRTSTAPILSARLPVEKMNLPPYGFSYRDILVATDGSEKAREAARHGAKIAERFDASLHLLYVIDVSQYNKGVTLELALQELENEADMLLDEEKRFIENEYDVEVETVLRQGNPHESIVNYSEENMIDLLTMGTHGRTGIHRYLLGSVTEKVVRTSSIPVLTV